MLLFFSIKIPLVSAQINLRFHHDMSTHSPIHYGVEAFKEKVYELSDGKININIYPNNILGDDIYSTELLQISAIHLAVIPTSKLANFHSPLKALDYPFLFEDKADTYYKLDNEMGNKLMEKLTDKGMVGFGFWESGFKQITCQDIFKKADINTEYPLKGISVRIMSSPILFEQYKAAQALPLVIPFSELYVALEHGTAKCQENPITSIATTKIYEVQNELLLSNHAYLGYVFIASKKWFETLTAEQQMILKEAEKYARNVQRERVAELEEGYLAEILKDNRVKLVSEDYIPILKKNFAEMKSLN